MSEAQIWSILEEKGYKRDYIWNHLDDGYISRIIGYPRDKDGNIVDDPSLKIAEAKRNQGSQFTPESVLRKMRNSGWRDWDIAKKLDELFPGWNGKQSSNSTNKELDQLSEDQKRGPDGWGKEIGMVFDPETGTWNSEDIKPQSK